MVRIYNKRHNDAPKNAKYVGRPTKHGNPFTVQAHGRGSAVILHEEWLQNFISDNPEVLDKMIEELRGFDLICWCAPRGGIDMDAEPKICHAQTIARLVNEVTDEQNSTK